MTDLAVSAVPGEFVIPDDPPTTTPLPEVDPFNAGLAEWLREQVWMGCATTPRSLQAELGMSEIGAECERRLAFKLAQTPQCNFTPDPMASLTGSGIHGQLAEIFARAGSGTARFLIEHPVSYRGVPGSVDLYDRKRRLVLDWKSTAKGKLRNLRKEGPPMGYVVQAHLYAAALRTVGEDPQRVALVFLPRDGDLTDLHVWSATPDQAMADRYVDRVEAIAEVIARNADPSQLPAKPSRLCGWCDHYLPNSTDPTRGCRGPNLT